MKPSIHPKRLVAAVATVTILTPLVVGAEPVNGGGQFVVRCLYSHSLPDDPVVFPGQPGASHLHDFFGNTSVKASSTVDSMLASDTTCQAASDTAGYWAPTAYLNGVQVTPTVMRIYYLDTRGQETETIPSGLQVIGGNRDAVSPADNPHVRWYCGAINVVRTPREDAPYDCSPWSQYAFVDGVIAIVDLPNCWDGVGLGAESVVYPDGTNCPPSHPRVLPRLSERIHYGVMNPLNPDGSMAFTLASGSYWSMHADFWNTWQQDRLDALVESCLSGVHCGSIDTAVSIDWSSQFGTISYDLGLASAVGPEGPYVAGLTNEALAAQTYRRGSDAYVRAFDPSGNLRWTRQFGSSGEDQALAVTEHGHRLVVAGFTDGRLPGQRPSGGADAFVTAYDDDGDLQWLLQFGSRRDEHATSAAATRTAVFVAGWTDGRLGQSDPGARDGWIAKLSWQGAIQWIRQFGSTGMDEVSALATQESRVLAAGWTEGSVRRRSSSGGSDAFVRAFNASGGIVWTRQFGTSGNDRATALAAYGNLSFVAGTSDGAFGRQDGAGGLDVFVRGIGGNGVSAWTDQFGTPADDEATDIVARRSGVYLVGSTLGALGEGGQLGGGDVFAKRYLRRGVALWTLQLGTAAFDQGTGAAIDADSLYVTGSTLGAFDGQANSGDLDAFLTRLRFT